MINLTKVTGIVPLALILAGFGVLAAVILAVVAGITAPAIKEAEQKSRNEVLLLLLPEGVANNPADTATEKDGVTYYGGFDAEGNLLGVVAKNSANGYAGTVELYIGMLPDGTVMNVYAGNHNETPGLGSVVLERRLQRTITNPFPEAEGLPPNEILDWFSGKKSDGSKWQISKDGGSAGFRTGATITSRAVCEALWPAAEGFLKDRENLCNEMRSKNGSY